MHDRSKGKLHGVWRMMQHMVKRSLVCRYRMRSKVVKSRMPNLVFATLHFSSCSYLISPKTKSLSDINKISSLTQLTHLTAGKLQQLDTVLKSIPFHSISALPIAQYTSAQRNATQLINAKSHLALHPAQPKLPETNSITLQKDSSANVLKLDTFHTLVVLSYLSIYLSITPPDTFSAARSHFFITLTSIHTYIHTYTLLSSFKTSDSIPHHRIPPQALREKNTLRLLDVTYWLLLC